MTLNLPYSIWGLVYNTDSSLIGTGVLVKARNNTTGEIVSDNTNSSSEYALDLGNLTSGYELTDSITIYVYAQSAYVEYTFLVSSNLHHFDLTLVTLTDSTLIKGYTTVQRVYEELDDAGSSEVSARRVINALLEAEREIDERSGMSFSSTTTTQEIYDWNQYTTNMSPERLNYVGGDNTRSDYWNVAVRDRLWLRNRPIVSITTLQRNTAGESSTDSWATLTENTGTSGDYVLTPVSKSAGYVDFVGNRPRNGKRAVRITYLHGYSTTPKNISRLATLLAVKSIVLTKISRSFFDSPSSISLRGIMIDRSGASQGYIKMLNEEIDRLWKGIGEEWKVV